TNSPTHQLTNSLNLEEVLERLSCIVRGRLRACLALDGRARREEGAGIPFVLRRDAGRQRLLAALPARAGVERHAVDAAVHGNPAAAAPGVGRHRRGQLLAAAGAAEDLVRGHQVGSARSGSVLQLTAGSPLGRRLPRAAGSAPLPVAVVVLVAALTVFAFAH